MRPLPTERSLPVSLQEERNMLKHLRLKRPLVFLDAESTGVNPQSDRVVEIALLGSVCLSLAVRPIAPR